MQRPGGRHEVGLVPQGRILLPKRCVRLAGPRGPFRHLAAISRALSRSPTLARLIPKATRLLSQVYAMPEQGRCFARPSGCIT